MKKSILIAGAGWAGKTIAETILASQFGDVVGFVDDEPSAQPVKINGHNFSLPVLGTSADLVDVIKRHKASAVVIAVTNERNDRLLSQMIRCYENGIPVYEMPELYSLITKKIPVHHSSQGWMDPHLTDPKHTFYNFFHQSVNYLISLFGSLFVVLPLLPIISLAILIDSGKPIFYRHRRVGKKSVPFTLLKFRTMKNNSDKDGSAWTNKDDNRVTRVGRWLRKHRLDELPQLLNVLKGDMALIGPRPEAVELVDSFKQEIPFYEYRYLVRPGITGWAQVNYEYTNSIEGALEKLQYDLYWIKNRSFWLDLKIIFKSFKVMLTGFGAV